MSHRYTHYWLWFLLFGLVGGLIYYHANKNTLDSESTWLLVSGLLGIVVGMNWLNGGKWARMFDIIIGVIFGGVGIVGILHGLDILSFKGSGMLISTSHGSTHLLGLSLDSPSSLINTVLGFTSLNHGIKGNK
ncbi:MAG TPA: hypothetical protein VGR88_10290 [Ktedonobacterales bacterium]|nr:hypothetical protein [Ktedonobacterales bacterium]